MLDNCINACSISQKKVTLAWKIQGKHLRNEFFSNFKVVYDEKVFFEWASINPLRATFSMVHLVFFDGFINKTRPKGLLDP